jgi:hypothetical protein
LSRLVSQRNDRVVTIESGTTAAARVHGSLLHGGLRHRTGTPELKALSTTSPAVDSCGFAFHDQNEGCNALIQVEVAGHGVKVIGATPVNKDNDPKARFIQRCASADAERAQLDKLAKHPSGHGEPELNLGELLNRIWITKVSPAGCRIRPRHRSGRSPCAD